MVITAGTADYGDRHRRPQTTPSPEEQQQQKHNLMAAMMVPERSKGTLTLPNFSSLPCFNVTWGRRVQLRCVKEDNAVDHHNDAVEGGADDLPLTRSEFNHHRKRRSSDDNAKIGIEGLGEKLILDFRAEVHQMQAAFLQKSDVVVPPTTAVETRPWNLRTRRAVCKEPNNFPASSDRKHISSPVVKSPARRNAGEVSGGEHGGERPRANFSGTLSKQEIEEDFLAMLGTRPARRPKKRPKFVQRQIDAVFPGYWLSEISADMYKVNEQPQTG
ncbi:uncharacterized protein LOC110715510 [Chenopodium quinoa]|uniref:DUF1639 family protein n=1 Tax=Chenopodium quinoa TaxID=63459 RepID=A0A803MYN4_CHEQI|nr:uncharacterized protein LOC110715510 [Chenopodium quinoa]